LKDQLYLALQSPDAAQALRETVQAQAAGGRSRDQLVDGLNQFLLEVRSSKAFPESTEDIILDLLDSLTGWCHPNARLLSD
jgi:hypothetical protein